MGKEQASLGTSLQPLQAVLLRRVTAQSEPVVRGREEDCAALLSSRTSSPPAGQESVQQGEAGWGVRKGGRGSEGRGRREEVKVGRENWGCRVFLEAELGILKKKTKGAPSFLAVC